MRKWIIISIIIFLVICGAVAIALINFNSYLNKNKQWLVQQVETALGRNVRFDKVDVSIIGGVSAHIKNLRIADDPVFSEKDFVRTADAQVAVKILPALFGRYELKRIVLDKSVVTIIRSERGFNFESIGKTKNRTAEKETPGPSEAATFLISLLKIQSADIRFIDRTSKPPADVMIQNLDFSASNVSLTTPIQVHVAAALFSSDRQNFKLNGTIGPMGTPPNVQNAPIEATINLDPLDIEVLHRELPVVAKLIPSALGLSGPIELKALLSGSLAKLSFSNLNLVASVFGANKRNLKVSGAIGPIGVSVAQSDLNLDTQIELGPVVINNMKKLDMFAKAFPPELSSPDPIFIRATVKGSPKNLSFKSHLDGSSAEIYYGSAFVKPKNIPLELNLDGQRSNDSLGMKTFTLRLAGLNLLGKGVISTGPVKSVDLQIDSNRASLAGWDHFLPALASHDVSGTFEVHLQAKGEVGNGQLPNLSGALTLESINARRTGSPYQIENLSTKISFNGDSAVLPPTKFNLGGSPVELEATVESFRVPTMRFTFESPGLRMASLGIDGKGVKKEEVIRNLRASGNLRTIEGMSELRASLRSSEGSFRDIDYKEMQTDFGLRNSVVTSNKIALRAFDGAYNGSGHYEMKAQYPKFNFQSVIQDMKLESILRSQFPGVEQRIEGNLNANLNVTGAGKDWNTIQKALKGNGKVEVKNGVLKDVNIVDGVLSRMTGIGGLSNLISPRIREKYSELFSTGDTRFDKLTSTIQIADGRARTDDLTLVARDYTILGKGTFDLNNQLDFDATLVASNRLTEDIASNVGAVKYITNEQGRLEVPFRLTGALPKVEPRPDSEFITKGLERAVIHKGIEKFIGGKEESTSGSEQKKSPPEENLLKKTLKGILGK